MNGQMLTLPILFPLACALLAVVVPARLKWFLKGIFFLGTAVNLLLCGGVWKKTATFSWAWLHYGWEISLRLYSLNAFILLSVAGLVFLIAMYSLSFAREKQYVKPFFIYLLISLSFVNGVVLSDNLLLLLFFWEGLLLTTFGMIYLGGGKAYKTATKAFVIVGVTDLCMMVGIGMTHYLAGTATISRINLPLNTAGSIAFILLMTGAIAKAGSMPFHTWIPDAAEDAPLPFMAFFPGAVEKLVGIYFLTRIVLDMFQLSVFSWLSVLLMVIGSVTILCAVMMALIQKDYKKLLSYHAISQVGYMILGIGTALPVGIIGGLFHMVNNALYKSCLFLTAGAVEKQTGTTDLGQLGGLFRRMPVTAFCFLITALSISGVPPFNGFFSKELVYDGALERGVIFYCVAIAGSFFTAASFLKLGHSVFLGKTGEKHATVKEVSYPMLVPMLVIAGLCIFFGVFHSFPVTALTGVLLGKGEMQGHAFVGFSLSAKLVIISVVVLAAAFFDHIYGVKMGGSALKSVDRFHYNPLLHSIYDKAERRFFDPYERGMRLNGYLSRLLFYCDRSVDWVYERLVAGGTFKFVSHLKRWHDGNYVTYVLWSLIGVVLVTLFLLTSI